MEQKYNLSKYSIEKIKNQLRIIKEKDGIDLSIEKHFQIKHEIKKKDMIVGGYYSYIADDLIVELLNNNKIMYISSGNTYRHDNLSEDNIVEIYNPKNKYKLDFKHKLSIKLKDRNV